eukprot:363603-Chlamydomonas_euryale.AAC.7
MQGDWTGVRFDYADWRSTGTHILRGLDDIQMLLDDQIVKTQSMRASPYIGPFEVRSLAGTRGEAFRDVLWARRGRGVYMAESWEAGTFSLLASPPP